MRRPGRIPNRAKTKRSRLDRDADTSWMTEDDKQADFMAGIDFGGIVQGVPANQCVQLDGEVVRMESERLENDAIRTSHAPNCRSDLDEEPLLLFSAVLEEAIFVADAFGSFLEDLDESHEEEECSSIDDADPFYEIDDERSEDIVCHDAIAERTQMSYTVCLAASLSTSIYKRLSAAFFEEDDAIAAAAVRKTEKGVTVEGAAKAADEYVVTCVFFAPSCTTTIELT